MRALPILIPPISGTVWKREMVHRTLATSVLRSGPVVSKPRRIPMRMGDTHAI